MNLPTFEEFRASLLAQGWDEVLERSWAPHTVLDIHTHPFDARAIVVRGEMVLGRHNGEQRLGPGDGFELSRDTPHTERYGPEGATYWVARRA